MRNQMRKTLTIAILLLLTFPFVGQAQIPGYMGKRASIHLNFQSFPEFFEGPQENNNTSFLDTGFNTEFGLEFFYVVRRLHSVSFHFDRF